MADERGCLLSARYYRDFVAGKRAEIISQKLFLEASYLRKLNQPTLKISKFDLFKLKCQRHSGVTKDENSHSIQ